MIACAAWFGSLAGAAGAQGFTSPRGLLGLEGNSSHFALFDPGYGRFMQIDDTQRATPAATLRGIAFRRDGERANPTATARTLDLTIRLGLGDQANATSSFAANWAASPTTVFTRKSVNVPDWSQLAASRPAPFDLALPFDQSFGYDGSASLAFEFVLENTTGWSGPEVDAERGSSLPYAQATGTAFDYGCLVLGHPVEVSHALALQNWGPTHPQYGLRIGSSVLHAPRSQPAVLNLDISDPGIVMAGACATLHALPIVSIPLGTTTAQGSVAPTWVDLPYAQGLEGIRLFTQVAVLDPQRIGLPVSLSERRDAIFPDAPRPAPACSYLYATSPTATSATVWSGRGVVVRFDR